MWSYSQGSSGSEYNGPSFLFMFQIWPQGFYCISKQVNTLMRIADLKKQCFFNIDPLIQSKKI